MTWEWHRIGDVLLTQPNRKAVQQGWSPRCHSNPAPEGKWGVLKTTAIQDGRFEPEHNKELPAELAPRDHIEVRAGDLLLTCAGPRARCGVPALVRHTRPQLMMSGKMYRMRPDDRVLPEFLELWLRSPDAQRRIDRMKTGISDSGLNLTHDRFVALPVPVPALAEQREMVEHLEDHLLSLDAARKSVNTAIRRSSAMVTSSLAATVAAGSAGTPISTVGAEAERVEYGSSAKCHTQPSDGDIPVLRMGNLQNGELDWRDLKFLPKDHQELPKLLLAPGDLLFNRTNSAELVGKSAVFDSTAVTSFASYLIRVRFGVAVDPKWASIVINSPQGRAYIASVRTQQVGQANVNGTKLKAFPLPLPPLVRQRELVASHEQVFDEARRLCAAADNAVRRSVALQRSLLTSAFSGQITAKTAIA